AGDPSADSTGSPQAGSGQAIPRDDESVRIWKELGVTDIREYGREDNFWGPTGAEGPCGPSTEIYVNDVEVWNVVFNEFYKEKDGTYRTLEKPGVDTGMGLERLTVALQGVDNIFETDLFTPLLAVLPQDIDEKSKRVIVDHARGAAFLLSDGVRPSNKEAGYVLRRLIRRALVLFYLHRRGAQTNPGVIREEAKEFFGTLFDVVMVEYGTFYPGLNREVIGTEFNQETDKFMATLTRGIKEVERIEILDAPAAFKLYESFGLPYEVIREVAPEKTSGLSREAFDAEMEAHRAKSREGSEAKFGGHGLLLDTGELKARDEAEVVLVTRLHTATHLLQAGLRTVLGEGVHQDGSDITAERLRFDFTFDRKVADDELRKVEAWVNEQIQKNLTVSFAELPYEEAIASGALYFVKEKYPPVVKVYTMGGEERDVVSKEFCGGPHVGRTAEVGVFTIIKEESVSAGVRRIRAVVE
ncbi:MAG: alanine--tRNA ligase-related protein, partial [Candidatus Spechtbacterales bacterium]